MRILVLNVSPRPEGNMKKMIAAFEEGTKLGEHQVDVVDVCQKKIGGCMWNSEKNHLCSVTVCRFAVYGGMQ